MAEEEYSAGIDAELRALLPALQEARNGQVVALVQGHRMQFIGLMPFHIYARWPDALPWLPLTFSATVVPSSAVDLSASSLPIYRVRDVRQARKLARWSRYTETRYLPDDLVFADWENGASRMHTSLDVLDLPPHSFISVERVLEDGTTSRIPRPVLGRHADRQAQRPRLLIPGSRTSSRSAATLAGTDLLVLDLQGLRGQRSLRTVHDVLQSRPTTSPTVIIAGSVSDLLASGHEEPRDLRHVTLVGSPSVINDVTVVPIAQDRLAADQLFHQTLAGVAADVSERIMSLAEAAWWAMRQSVGMEGGRRELQRFQRALEDLTNTDPMAAGLLTACDTMLVSNSLDETLRTERLQAAVEATMSASRLGEVAVITRSGTDAATLRSAFATTLNVDTSDLEQLGVYVRRVHAAFPRTEFASAVALGYAGMATIDSILSTGAEDVRVVFDPVETRAAWHNARRMADYLHHAGVPDAAVPLERLAEGLAPYTTGFAQLQELQLDALTRSLQDQSIMPSTDKPAPDEVVVILLDGTRLRVPLGARFEVMGRHGRASHVVPVSSLEPGDQIVLLDDEARALFSEQRMAALDAGPLREQSVVRIAWLVKVRVVAEVRHLSATTIARSLAERGYPISDAAVRGWLSPHPNEGHAPMRLNHFLALAELLGIAPDSGTLERDYRNIKTWRVQHRRAGHVVAKAIRLACTGRLAPATLARIEHDWGVGVRALVDAAWVAEIDEVILPEVKVDA